MEDDWNWFLRSKIKFITTLLKQKRIWVKIISDWGFRDTFHMEGGERSKGVDGK